MNADFKENLYQFIADYIQQYNNFPSFAEMTEAMGISSRSKSLITRSLRALEKAGKIVLTKEGRRLRISITPKHLRLLGRISAGVPIEAISQHEYLDINTIFQIDNGFALQVNGNSMMNEGILHGDFIICKESSVANEGDIVVALIDESHTTLKRISFKTKKMIILLPANNELKPQSYAPDRIRIQGIYLGLIRKPSR